MLFDLDLGTQLGFHLFVLNSADLVVYLEIDVIHFEIGFATHLVMDNENVWAPFSPEFPFSFYPGPFSSQHNDAPTRAVPLGREDSSITRDKKPSRKRSMPAL